MKWFYWWKEKGFAKTWSAGKKRRHQYMFFAYRDSQNVVQMKRSQGFYLLWLTGCYSSHSVCCLFCVIIRYKNLIKWSVFSASLSMRCVTWAPSSLHKAVMEKEMAPQFVIKRTFIFSYLKYLSGYFIQHSTCHTVCTVSVVVSVMWDKQKAPL